MNISDDEIKAANDALSARLGSRLSQKSMRVALEAAYAARDAKRSKYRPMLGEVERVEITLQAELDKMDQFTGVAG